MINLQSLIDDAKCYETVRILRWAEGVRCPHCAASPVTQQGRDATPAARQTYHCTACERYFDDLTGTVFAGHPQPLRVWILCWYFRGLNLSNRQIAQALGLNPGDVQQMTEQGRAAVVAAQPEPSLSGEVECDEGYVVAGPKGQPEAVKKKAVAGVAAGCGARVGAGPWRRRSPRSSGCSTGAVRWSSTC
jgi:transposase-like protein